MPRDDAPLGEEAPAQVGRLAQSEVVPASAPPAANQLFVSATHAVLFTSTSEGAGRGAREAGAEEPCCDACGDPMTPHADDDDEGFAVSGSGVYLWCRGTEVRYEEAPLCASCAAAIGMSALGRWEIEEEEG